MRKPQGLNVMRLINVAVIKLPDAFYDVQHVKRRISLNLQLIAKSVIK